MSVKKNVSPFGPAVWQAIHTELDQWGRYDRPGTVKSPAATSKLRLSLHRIGSGRYLPHMTEAGTRVSSVRI